MKRLLVPWERVWLLDQEQASEEKDAAMATERDGRGQDSRTECGLKHMKQGGPFGILTLNSKEKGGFIGFLDRFWVSLRVRGSTSLPGDN